MMAVNLSLCLLLLVYRVSTVYAESLDVTLTEPKPEVSEGVRCYCNTAQCVSTGYMCRSTRGGGCYSELPAPRRHHASHGCLQHLADTAEEAVSRCQNSPSADIRPPSREHSLLLCCFRDLCNHEDSPLARARLNLTHDSEGNTIASDCGASYNSEVWFKAATIAVPVCGAIILFLLVAVAVRLLKADALLHADRKLREAQVPNSYRSILEDNTIDSDCGASYKSEVWFKAATIAVPVCGAIILFLLVAVAVRLLKADALLHADRKLRGGYSSPLAQHSEDVKKVWVGNSAPLLVAPGGCLVAVERAQLVDVPVCDIQR
ncbi:uncharacterized protein LOC134669899 [Cydia fagiglandana]|uniref:uncharacterized protein LOC134669899 n=1 Tax=Cydia fagiglandana TaxID=1458189 RepID=UPI002FEE654B